MTMRTAWATLALTCGVAIGCGSSSGSSSSSPQQTGGGGSGGDAGQGGSGGQGGPDASAGGSGGNDAGASTVCHFVGDGEKRVSAGTGSSSAPSLVWTGEGFTVAFASTRSGSGDIYVVKLDDSGNKMGDDVLATAGTGTSQMPSLAQTSGGMLLAWQDTGGATGTKVQTATLGADGKAMGAPVTIGTSSVPEARPWIAPALGAAAVAWMDGTMGAPSSKLASIGLDANLTAGPLLVGVGGQSSWPSVAGNDALLGASWGQPTLDHVDVHLALYGAGIAYQSDVTVRSGAPGAADNTRVAWDGTGFWVAWEDLRTDSEEVWGARVGADGAASPATMLHAAGTGSANWPSISSDGGRTGVAYYQFRDGPPQIFVSLVGPDGQRIGEEMQVSSAPKGKARFPSIAATPDGFGVAWEDTRDGNPAVWFARLTCP